MHRHGPLRTYTTYIRLCRCRSTGQKLRDTVRIFALAQWSGEMIIDVLLGLDTAALMASVKVRRWRHLEPFAGLTPQDWILPVQFHILVVHERTLLERE